jgi:polysaccharide biosynthesis protein VpsI
VKVALLGPSISQKGGVVTVLKELNSYLDDVGVDVSLIATTAEGTRFRRVWAYVRAVISILRACVPQGCDVVHLHMASRGSCLRKSILALFCFVFRTPYIIHLHGAEFSTFYELELNKIGRSYVSFVFHRAACVVALSESWKTWIDRSIGGGNTQVIFNGVASLSVQSSSEVGKPTVLFLGRLGERKGVADLIAAARTISAVIPNVIFEFGGDGELRRFREDAADLPNVKFLGWLDNIARVQALGRASVLCLPSWSEGLPMSVLEAMAAGLPVISTPVGGIPEAVEDGVTGMLVSPGDVAALSDALVKVLSDVDLADSMGRKGRERQRAVFSRESMGAACTDLYTRTVLSRECGNG